MKQNLGKDHKNKPKTISLDIENIEQQKKAKAIAIPNQSHPISIWLNIDM